MGALRPCDSFVALALRSPVVVSYTGATLVVVPLFARCCVALLHGRGATLPTLSSSSKWPPPTRPCVSRPPSRSPHSPSHNRGARPLRRRAASFPGPSGRFRENRHGTVAFWPIFKRRICRVWRLQRGALGVCNASPCARRRRCVAASCYGGVSSGRPRGPRRRRAGPWRPRSSAARAR